MNNFEIDQDQSMALYVDIVGRTQSLLVAAWEEGEIDDDGNMLETVIDNDLMFESLNQSFSKWCKAKLSDVSVSFPAHHWDDEDEDNLDMIDYTATMKLTDFDISVQFSDADYYGGLKLEFCVGAPNDNEDYDNENSIEPIVLLAAWKVAELLNADEDLWNDLKCQAWEDSVTYEIAEEVA